MISVNRLKSLFDYHADGGLIVLQVREGSRRRIGDVIMATQSDPYYRISVDGTMYLLHRLIYLWHTGELPKFIDHIDLDPRNNRIENLREATRTQNRQNTRGRTGASKYKGVSLSWNKKWRATIKGPNGLEHLGYFLDEKEAAYAYDQAAERLFGEFAYFNMPYGRLS